MKKTLLLLMITGVLGSLHAQNTAPAKTSCITISPVQVAQMRIKARQAEAKAVAANSSANPSKRNHRIGSNEPLLPFLGSSANAYGVLDATTTAVSANEACNLITMTHRDNNSNVGTCGSGAYIAAYSTNNGATWDSTITLFCNSDPVAGTRYPNGVIFNPAGNTTPSNAYDVVSGPYTNGNATTISWIANVHGSVTFGNTNPIGTYWDNDSAGVETENTGDLSFMSSSDDSTVHVIGEGYKENSAQTGFTVWLGAVLSTGKFHGGLADSFVWSQQVFRPHIVPGYAGFNNSLSVYDSDAAPLMVPGTAWSQDGKTGYVVIFANLDSTGYNYYTDQPIVYKTVNSGQTWNMMPPFNFRTLPALTAHLETTLDSAGVKIPLWFAFNTTTTPNQSAVNNYDLTVDYQGNLHILGVVVSSVLCSPDSSFTVSFHANQDGYIYDVSTAGAGWNARLIDSMMTDPSNNAGAGSINTDWDSTSSTTYIGFGNRLQASRTTDGKHVFCTWEDDLTQSSPNQLIFPDVYGEGYDVATSKAGQVYQFTNTTNNYFLCVSDIALTTASGGDTTYTIPCTIAFPQETPDDGVEPVNYFYLGNVVYNDTLGSDLSVPAVASQKFSISQNYPNPFNNTTQFNISLTAENLVSVDVFNLFGQKVYSIPTQQMSSGNHLMTIKAAGWSAGVYFYRVTVGDQSKTQKMVVQ